MAIDFVAIQKNPWKITQTLNGFGPVCSLVSLYDLIFNSDDDTSSYDSYRISASGAWVSGLKLDHDIICYNSGVYNTAGDVIKTNKENFLNYGLDICPVKFDPAAKAHDLVVSYVNSKNQQVNSTLKVRDKAAALYPSSSVMFEGFAWDSVDPDSTAELTYTPVSVGIGSSGTQLSTTFQLSETDPIFNATIKQDGLTSYTKIALSTNNYKTWQIIGHFIEDINSQIDTLLYPDLRTLLHNYKDALRYCYVWVKTRYFADYINPNSFTQDLTTESDVQHRNLNVSASGDFNRYEKNVVSTDESKASAHRPYIPKTVPSVDLLSDAIFPGYKFDDETDVQTVIDGVIKKTAFSDKDDSAIGQLQTTPVNTLYTDAEGTSNEPSDHLLDSLSHPGYYDPESRMTAAEYDHKPTLVPKNGNVVTDGRIMSPTIDEIWVYIKRLVDGRLNDDTASDPDVSRPKAETSQRKITEDLLPVAPKNFRISDKLNVTRIGDPLDTTIINTDNSTVREKLVIKSYINSPEGLSLDQYAQLKLISDAIIGPNETSHGIAQLTPWQENPASYDEIRDSNAIQPDTVNVTLLQKDATWGPRPNPLSMREVEALLKQAKLNMISLARFMKENLTVTGGLGRELNGTDPTKKAQGGLYQLHKDYNFKVDDPNTIFGATDGGLSLPVGETRAASGSILGRSKAAANDYYGQSPEIPTGRNEAGSSEVYLAADGTWRALWTHVRVPIVTEEF